MSFAYTKPAFVASPKPEAQDALERMVKLYGQTPMKEADVIVALGGDGFLLGTLHRNIGRTRAGLPIYGMNRGTVGFLMNEYREQELFERLARAEAAKVQPLRMVATSETGEITALAINEVSLLRQTRQAAHIEIRVDGKARLERLIADGVLLATPAGSTAYNLSAHGPVLPVGSEILALTPISAFRPRRWRGALLNYNAKVEFVITDPLRRPVSATADDQEFRDVSRVSVEVAKEISLTLLFDEGHELDEKILREQFST